jgi:opacity protein-like surface antigen
MQIHKTVVLGTIVSAFMALGVSAMERKYIYLEGGWAMPGKLKSTTLLAGEQTEHYGARPSSAAIYGGGVGVQLLDSWEIALSALRVNSMSFAQTRESGADKFQLSQKFDSSAFFVHMLYDLPYVLFDNYNIAPFVSLSIGASQNGAGPYNIYKDTPFVTDEDWALDKKTNNCFAYGLGVGLNYTFEKVKFSLGYKFYHLGKIETASEGIDMVRYPSGELRAFDITLAEKFSSTLDLHAIMFGVKSYF